LSQSEWIKGKEKEGFLRRFFPRRWEDGHDTALYKRSPSYREKKQHLVQAWK
jgi:hypothetical protein